MNNYGIPLEIPENFSNWDNRRRNEYFESKYYSNEKLFEDVKAKLLKYDAIFIDEVQDFKYEWLRLIKDNFLKTNGEYVLFGDEKQNIFKQKMDTDRKPRTNVPGQWNQTLKKTFRLSNKAAQIAEKFQKQFFDNRYDPDEIEVVQDDLFEKFVYLNIQTKDYEKIFSFVKTNIEQIKAHPNDCCILAEKIDTLKEMDSLIRHTTNQNTQTMFETKEVDMKLFFEYLYSDEKKYIENAAEKFIGDTNKKLNQLVKALSYWEYLNHPSAEKRFSDTISNSDFDTDSFRKWFNEYAKSKKELTRSSETEKFQYRDTIDIIRKGKKRQFRMNPGTIKLSTIHSFKGWEIKNLFLIIENDPDDFNDYISAELIYTAITRTRNNLFIINLNNQHFHNFFSNLNI